MTDLNADVPVAQVAANRASLVSCEARGLHFAISLAGEMAGSDKGSFTDLKDEKHSNRDSIQKAWDGIGKDMGCGSKILFEPLYVLLLITQSYYCINLWR
jgi:hypothetical protein